MFNRNKKIVLLVEPDDFLASIYKKNLVMEGYEVTTATSAERGFQLAEKKKPAVIVTEVALRDADGFGLLVALKKSKKTRDVPVFFLTKLGGREEVARGMSLGAAGFIIKQHFRPSEVVDKIKKHIGN